LSGSASPRSRTHDQAKQWAAARFLVRNPRASLAKIAKGCGLPASQKTTVSGYLKSPTFWLACANQVVEFDEERASTIHDAYRKRFGEISKVGFAPLWCLVPAMVAALDGSASPISLSDVDRYRRFYFYRLKESKLRSRLLPVQ
jgi:hypothetical protein